MLLILFRHGPAGQADPKQWPDDSKRPLTTRGEDRTQRAARGLARLAGSVRRVLTSPYARCARTAELVATALDASKPQSLEELAPGGAFRKLLQAIPSAGENE